jgi:hypothetical protein
MHGGDQPDLLVIDPLSGEPVIVEFKSRIREARRSTLGGLADKLDWQDDLDPQRWAYGPPSAGRSAELGVVVSLLIRADDGTLRRIREMLEDEVGYPSRATNS